MKYFITVLLLVATSYAATIDGGFWRSPEGESVEKASLLMLKEAFESAADKNVIVSPLGALTLLSMYSAGTEGQSRDEIMQLLGSADYKELQETYSSLTLRYSSMDPSSLVLANKMYLSDKYTLNDQFSNTSKQAYNSEVEVIDFVQKDVTANTINKWAAETSDGHIISPVDEDTCGVDTTVALFNIIYFKGCWNIPFSANETQEKEFYVDESRTKKKQMMSLSTNLFYKEDPDIGASMVELPYKEEGFRMVIVLPFKKDGLPEVLEKMAKRSAVSQSSIFSIIRRKQEVALEVPKFEIETALNLKTVLQKLGVSRIFTEGAPGVAHNQSLVVSKAFQKAFVKVDEDGATAGAFTGFVLEDRFGGIESPTLEFIADHPFLFAILHEDIVLFTGTYTH